MKISKEKILKGIIFTLSFLLIIGAMSLFDVYKNREGYKEKLIRFHVIANSDSPEDQELKLKIRDKVINEMNKKFEKSKSLGESREIIENNLNEMALIASNEIKELGSNYNVNIDFGEHSFPTKSYGNFTLPAGDYEAVRIVIGEGQGENWWCVMFPPLCFIDMKNGLTSGKTKDQLQNVLTEEEFSMITKAKSEDEVPLKLKFKVVEIFQKSKNQFAKLFVSEK